MVSIERYTPGTKKKKERIDSKKAILFLRLISGTCFLLGDLYPLKIIA
jgi:hypothetical protein